MSGWVELEFKNQEEAEKFEKEYDDLHDAIERYINNLNEEKLSLLFLAVLREQIVKHAVELMGFSYSELIEPELKRRR